ncbi:hypothetical protein UFOVP1309_78 [uncultured Caudovirales phage]|uniref:Uncharacterized protein n=1 Tax=uncultured Caudovirales phage TaxID=2100421 RepID=A0A6J5S0K8_9CAUD|nr:hypothetical protein UFOVP1309_78 [uncultured Caudovirales phage]
MTDKQTLLAEWLQHKADETKAQDKRREVEDKLAKLLNIDATKDGTKTEQIDGFECKVTTRLNRKIDSDLAQEIAVENGIEDQLGIVFRWKPDLNLTAWKSASDDIKSKLIKAITTTASRPSFSITLKTKD